MGRSRGVRSSGDDDASQRSKRRKAALSGENLETMSSGPATAEGKKVLYHCNYCNKDISGKIRVKCAKCPDFDLCVECFSVGAEVTPHKSNHPYRVMDNLSFPLISPDWNADEEILLLEGIEMYGLGNWAEVAEHVGTKNKAECFDHYRISYSESPSYPLPDMSRVDGKSRKEILAMAQVQGAPVQGDATPKAESPFSPSRVKVEDLSRDAPAGRSPTNLATGAGKKSSGTGLFRNSNDGARVENVNSVEDPHADIGLKKPNHIIQERPSISELSGYNPKREEFEPEYDSDAEKMLAEMEFKKTDSDLERELKLRILRIYSSRLDERKRRKDFVLERNLLYPDPMDKELCDEDRAVYQRFKVFMRFQSKEDHEALVQTVIEERRLRRRIQELQECRAAGCRTRAEAKLYLERKKKREAETSAQKAKESSIGGASSEVIQKVSRPLGREKCELDGSPHISTDNQKMKGGPGLESGGDDPSLLTVGHGSTKLTDEWDITGLPGADLLSEHEQQLCSQNRLLPCHFLKIQEALVQEIFKGTVVKKSDAYRLFDIDSSKVDRVYDLVVKKLGTS